MSFWDRIARRALRKIKRVEYATALRESDLQIGDNVRALSAPETDALRVSGRVGTVYGQTVPSSSGVEIVGSASNDYAVSLFFEESGESYWFADHLVEFVDHGAGATVKLKGVDKEWVRMDDDTWEERAT
jgi:hypothetical protein